MYGDTFLDFGEKEKEMFVLDSVNCEIDRIEEIVTKIYSSDRTWYAKFAGEAKGFLKLMDMFISIVPALNSKGVDISKKVLEIQLSRVNESIIASDFMMLADVMKYEIKDSLMVLRELIEEGIVKNEELL